MKIQHLLAHWDGENLSKAAPIIELEEAVVELTQAGELVTLRFRQLKDYPDPYVAHCEKFVAQIKDGKVAIPVGEKTRTGNNNLKAPEKVFFNAPVDEPFQCSVQTALLLLNREPYKFMFEEVDDVPKPKPSRSK